MNTHTRTNIKKVTIMRIRGSYHETITFADGTTIHQTINSGGLSITEHCNVRYGWLYRWLYDPMNEIAVLAPRS